MENNNDDIIIKVKKSRRDMLNKELYDLKIKNKKYKVIIIDLLTEIKNLINNMKDFINIDNEEDMHSDIDS
jgi:hypothetical protein